MPGKQDYIPYYAVFEVKNVKHRKIIYFKQDHKKIETQFFKSFSQQHGLMEMLALFVVVFFFFETKNTKSFCEIKKKYLLCF